MTQGGAVWNRQEPLGVSAGGTTFGTVAAPLLAGFSLSAVIGLVDVEDGGLRGDVAIAAFAAAAGLLVFAIQSAIQASRFQVGPAERLAWYPEVRAAPNVRAWLRRTQWRDERLADKHRTNARRTYNAGVLAFLAGLVAVLIPDPGDWSAARVVALALGASALLVELVLVSGFPAPLRRALHPEIGDDARDGADEPAGAEGRRDGGMPEMTDELLVDLVPELALPEAPAPDWPQLLRVLTALEQRLAVPATHPNGAGGSIPGQPQRGQHGGGGAYLPPRP